MAKNASPETENLSIREFARRDGCSEKRVRNAIVSGHLQANVDGKLSASLIGTGWRLANRQSADTPAKKVRTPMRTPRKSVMVSAPRPVGSAPVPTRHQLDLGVSPLVLALAAVVDQVPGIAVSLLAGVLPRAVLEPVLTDLLAAVRQRICDVLQVEMPPSSGAPRWEKHPVFACLVVPEDPWAGLDDLEAQILTPTSTKAESERVKEFYLAQTRKLEYQRAAAAVAYWSDVEDVVGTILDSMRTAMLALPSKATPLLMGLKRQQEVHAMLTQIVYDALTKQASSTAALDQLAKRMTQRAAARR